MAKTLLRSGFLDDFLALGENGQPVFDSARQIRETLRLRRLQVVADSLAIPQLNDDGDRVDWYASFSGKVTTWSSASDSQRKQALKTLEKYVDNIASLSQRCLQSGNASIQLFGALLAKAVHFPGANHLFLVDDKPVITFWGFLQLNQDVQDDVLECLRHQEPVAPVVIPEPEPEETAPPACPPELSSPDEPLLYSKPKQAAPTVEKLNSMYAEQPETQEEAPPASPPVSTTSTSGKKRPVWLVPVAAAVAVAIAAPAVWWGMNQQDEPVQASSPQPPVQPAPQKTTIAPLPMTLPLARATVVAPPPPPPPEIKPVTPPKNALEMPVTDVRMGTTRFLNGNWHVTVKPQKGLDVPDVMRYQIQKNKGTVRFNPEKNVTCRAEIFSGLLKTGQLMIKPRSSARCSNGSRFPMPEIACEQGENNIAVCSAKYNDQPATPVTLIKVSK
ncbi:SrfA family protein [Mangrovibacter yixingensis]|uniref:SrfA family protein n=1 Tax=Mangrovibacter yixingensis TaxID=1529639 RepID=UPI001CF97D1D|nr:SrfA family protein [Mangrovibacter yixingensis]